MSTFSLSGSGTHALTVSTTGLQVTITTPSNVQGVGLANPANHYHTGMIRFSDGTAYWDPVPITGGPQFIPVPQNATSLGYAMQGGAAISVTEVIGGTVFFSAGGSSGSGAWTLISSHVLAAIAASVTFASISNAFSYLKLFGVLGINTGSSTTFNCGLELNSDVTDAHYSRSLAPSSGSGVGFVQVAGASNCWSPFDVMIPDYANSTRAKALLIVQSNQAGALGQFPGLHSGAWLQTAAITQIKLNAGSGSFLAGSRFDLYGI